MVQLTAKGEKAVSETPNPVQGKMIFGLSRLRPEDLNPTYDSFQEFSENLRGLKCESDHFLIRNRFRSVFNLEGRVFYAL